MNIDVVKTIRGFIHMGEELKIVRQIKGKHGMINILETKGESSQEEIDDFYKKLANLLIRDYKEQLRKAT